MSRENLGAKHGWPYRYQCPDCESHAIHELTRTERQHNKTYSGDGHGKQAAQRDARKPFRCLACNDRKAHVWDKRDERLVKTV